MIRLVFSGGGRYKHQLIDLALELIKTQRAVVPGRRQPKSIVYQRSLPALIPEIHAPDLRNRFMRFINDDQKIIRKIVDQCMGRGSRGKPCQMSGIVFNTGTKPRFLQHFNIKIRTLRNPLCFQKLVLTFEIAHPLFQFFFNIPDCLSDLLHGHHIMRCRKNCNMIQLTPDLPGEHVNLQEPLDLISEKFHPNGRIRRLGRENLHHIPPNPESSSFKIHLVPVVLNIDEFSDHLIPVPLHARPKRKHHVLVIHRRTQSVDAGNTGNDDHIPALCQSGSSRKPQLVNLVVDGGILGNIGVRGGHVGFGLVVIVVGHKILHRILREHLLEFSVELRRKRLVVGDDQRRLLQFLNDIRHRKCLAGTRNP